jgi:hypothetical protein
LAVSWQKELLMRTPRRVTAAQVKELWEQKKGSGEEKGISLGNLPRRDPAAIELQGSQLAIFLIGFEVVFLEFCFSDANCPFVHENFIEFRVL